MQGARHFRSEAAKCRSLAKTARDKMTAINLLDLACDYDSQAKQIDLDASPNGATPAAE